MDAFIMLLRHTSSSIATLERATQTLEADEAIGKAGKGKGMTPDGVDSSASSSEDLHKV